MIHIIPINQVLEDILSAVSTTTFSGSIGSINSFRMLQIIDVAELSMTSVIPSVLN